MSLLSKFKAKLAAHTLIEEQLYSQAAAEVTAEQIRPGLWAKALAESNGDERAAKARYLTLRVETLQAEIDIAQHKRKTTEKVKAPITPQVSQEELEGARQFLLRNGYLVKPAGRKGFKIKEQLGGFVHVKTTEDVILYAVARGFLRSS